LKQPWHHRLRAAALGIGVLLASAVPLAAQAESPDLAALVARAREANPEIQAAQERVAAARARLEASGAPPDPRLGVGLVNALVGDPFSSEDMMTMRMIQLGQVFPFPGKLGLERDAARWELAEAEAEHDRVEREVVAEVEKAYFELYFLDRALVVVERNRDLLGDFVAVTETRYQVGTGTQHDVLKSQVEGTRLGEELLTLAERRAAAVAALNALLDRPAESSLGQPALPDRVERAAVPEPGTPVRFTAAALTSETDGSDSPIPELSTLQRMATEHNPELRASAARIERERAEAELAAKASLPDFDVSLGYGQRGGREDMMTAMVSVPLPLFKGRKQDPLVRAEEAEARDAEAAHRALVNDVNARLAALHASLVRARERIALLREGVLPQAHAALESAILGYPVGRNDFLTLLDNQATVFRYDLDTFRLLADFAADLAELERTVGTEVVR
jgi:cobalt-zinc-cadmium efflux system outer membrane protein